MKYLGRKQMAKITRQDKFPCKDNCSTCAELQLLANAASDDMAKKIRGWLEDWCGAIPDKLFEKKYGFKPSAHGSTAMLADLQKWLEGE